MVKKLDAIKIYEIAESGNTEPYIRGSTYYLKISDLKYPKMSYCCLFFVIFNEVVFLPPPQKESYTVTIFW